jgi:lysophospholipase L1-like esterase
VIIPTKETVFADYLQADQHLHLKDSVDAVIANERAARAALGKWLDERDIPYVDTLPALRQAVSNELYYRGPADMHPSKNGYKVIGDVVSEFLREVGSRSK